MKNRYPNIVIRSKNELAKRISSKKLPPKEALSLINDVLINYDKYWKDSKKSNVKEQKFLRTTVGTPLNTLLRLIDRKILKPHDQLIPDFIFGGVSGRSHIDAAYSLLGEQRKRVLLEMDISKFYEQISRKRVFYFFHKKSGCSVKASNILADLCCVPLGKKGGEQNKQTKLVLARGFSTSPRLAIWTNLDFFLKLKWEMHKQLKYHNPKIVMFVDDIGLSASRVSIEKMRSVQNEFEQILLNSDRNQPLPINQQKTLIQPFKDGAEHLGIRLGRNKISLGKQTQAKFNRVKTLIKKSGDNKLKKIMRKKRAYHKYKQQLQDVAN